MQGTYLIIIEHPQSKASVLASCQACTRVNSLQGILDIYEISRLIPWPSVFLQSLTEKLCVELRNSWMAWVAEMFMCATGWTNAGKGRQPQVFLSAAMGLSHRLTS